MQTSRELARWASTEGDILRPTTESLRTHFGLPASRTLGSRASNASKTRIATPSHDRRPRRGLLLLLFLLLTASEGHSQAIYKNDKFSYTYSNVRFGYTVSYPNLWSPSGIAYSNAFEIRNYDTQAPESVAERNRASVIVVDTINENPRATDTFLKGLEAAPPFCIEQLSIDTHRAVRVVNRMPAQQLGPGTARTRPSGPQEDDAKFYLSIDLHIANGKHLISITARVPVEADATVLEEILRIENSVKFQTREDR